jgi:hypothetical protein
LDLACAHYPDAEKIVLVIDNLNTHTLASLYPTFSQLKRGAWRKDLKSTIRPNREVEPGEIHGLLAVYHCQCPYQTSTFVSEILDFGE